MKCTMLIYLTHSTAFDFINDLYQPLKSSAAIANHDLILPHEKNIAPINSKEVIQQADLVLAEVSYPSTGQGIELGWAEMLEKPIICFHQEEKHPSKSLAIITATIFFYKDTADLVKKIELLLKKI